MNRLLAAVTMAALALVPVLEVGTASAAVAATADGTTAAALHGWGAPIAGDEFDRVGAPQQQWSVYDGPGHHGQGRRSPSAWYGDGQTMTVSGSADGVTGGMSAAWPGSDQQYGRWEVRMRTSTRDPRYHAVLLLWPQDGYARGKCDGEVDFSESTRNLRVTHFFLHHGCDNRQTTVAVPNDTTQWHDYAVEWTPAGITGYLDGQPWFSDTDPAHLPTHPMHVAVQLDYFPGDGVGPLAPTSMSIDWVRQYG